MRRITLAAILAIGLLVGIHVYATEVRAQAPISWREYTNLSNMGAQMQETPPVIAADSFGYVHVFWTGRNDAGSSIYYARHRDFWEGPVDIIMAPNALVSAALVDADGDLHLIWMGNNQIYHSRAHVNNALSAWGWDSTTVIGDRVASASSYAADIAMDSSGTMYVVYGDSQSANVYVVQSADNGVTWTDPRQIGEAGRIQSEEAATEIQLAYEKDSDTLHVVWTARELPRGWPGTRLFYSHTSDQGATWTPPVVVDDAEFDGYAEDRGPFFPTLSVAAQNEVHLTWSGAPKGERWHQWSSNGGMTWSRMSPIDVFNQTALGLGIPGTTGFTDMVVDGSGQLYAATTIGNSGAPRLAAWHEGGWGPLYDSPYPGADCEDPRIVVTEGNMLHLVCLERGSAEKNDVWYVSARTDALQTPSEALPPPSTAEPSSVAEPNATVVSTPTMRYGPVIQQFSDSVRSPISTPFWALAVSAIPALVIVCSAILVRRNLFRLTRNDK